MKYCSVLILLIVAVVFVQCKTGLNTQVADVSTTEIYNKNRTYCIKFEKERRFNDRVSRFYIVKVEGLDTTYQSNGQLQFLGWEDTYIIKCRRILGTMDKKSSNLSEAHLTEGKVCYLDVKKGQVIKKNFK
ncbi:hypothetical protein E9993_19755 [Labilibacter sediminis]|nr:hypothetical protein E9993_19755 [Labilibacter sediminis]